MYKVLNVDEAIGSFELLRSSLQEGKLPFTTIISYMKKLGGEYYFGVNKDGILYLTISYVEWIGFLDYKTHTHSMYEILTTEDVKNIFYLIQTMKRKKKRRFYGMLKN